MNKDEVRAKYTEQELKNRHVGKCIDERSQSAEWKLKRDCYCREDVWGHFTVLRDSIRPLLVDSDNYRYNEIVNKVTQIMMDAFLIRRARGENVKPPKAVVPENAVMGEKSGIALINKNDFTDSSCSENDKIRWIFENMQMEGVMPADAPSSGTWALLQELRGNAQQRSDFYKTTYTKLLTKEDAEKGGKLQDDGKEVIDLLERLKTAVEGDS